MNTLPKVTLLLGMLEMVATGLSGYALAPAKDGDPVLIGTVWKGKLTQKGDYKGIGGGPPEFECVLTVTKRDGEKFEADLHEKTTDLELTYIVRGRIKPAEKGDKEKGYKIEWESVGAKDVKNTAAILKIPYTGTVNGKKMRGTWKHPQTDDGTTLEGEFEFELTSK